MMFADGANELALVAAASLTTAAAGVCAYGMFAPRSRLFGPVVCRSNDPALRAVALTFDDGPWPGSTDVILDVLARAQIRASFFVIGRYALEQPDLLRRIHDEGHVIANHSFDHDRSGMWRWGRYWSSQIDRTNDAIESATGRRPALFRPPMGFKSPHLMRAAKRAGCRIVTWTRRAFDGVRTTPEQIVRNVASSRPGEIVLLHDGRDPASRRRVEATARALPQAIAQLRARGLVLLRLDELIELPAYHAASPP